MTRSLAARTREAARAEPFLIDALAAELVNYTAAARYLADDIEGDPDEEAVATALSRFADDLARTTEDRTARVSMESGVGLVEEPDEALLAVGEFGIVPDDGTHTALVAEGDLDGGSLGAVLSRLSTAGIDPIAAGVAEGTVVVVVTRREGADAVRVVENSLDAVPAVDAE